MPLGASRIFGGFVNPTISDNFTRANASTLGSTPIGNKLWTNLVGTFSIFNNKATPSSTGTYNLTVVDILDANMDVTGNVLWGGDAVYFRVVDANNWWCAYTYGYSELVQVTSTYNYDDYVEYCNYGTANQYTCSGSGCNTCTGCCAGGVENSCSANGTCSETSTQTDYYSTLYLSKNVAGTITSVASASISTLQAPLEVIAVGGSYKVYFDGALQLSYLDPSPTNATKCGMGTAPSSIVEDSLASFTAIPL